MHQFQAWELPLLPPRITGMPLVEQLNSHLQLLQSHILVCEAKIAELERRLERAGESSGTAE